MIDALRSEMAAAGDPRKAAAMKAYMKSAMPYYGISSPDLARIYRRVSSAHQPEGCAAWRRTILDLWRSAVYREERYAAIALLSDRRHRDCVRPDVMPVIEEMVVTGAWWDLVDSLAHVVGDLLRSHPRQMRPVMRRWSTDPNLWKRRVSIICQLGFKRETDLDLLYANIAPNLADREFFICKAIGWALRQYAWTDPKEVERYVREHEAELSPLSRREALKNIGLTGSSRRSGVFTHERASSSRRSAMSPRITKGR